MVRLSTLQGIALFSGVLVFPASALVEPKNHQLNRRDALISSAALLLPAIAHAADDTTVDMAAINAARAKGGGAFGFDSSPTMPTKPGPPKFESSAANPMDNIAQMGKDLMKKPRPLPNQHAVVPLVDPPAKLNIKGGIDNKAKIPMPRMGCSLYQTPPNQASQKVAVALKAGVRHIDLATQYGTNKEAVPVLQKYLNVGPEALTPFLKGIDTASLDAIRQVGEDHAQKTGGGNTKLAPPPAGSVGRRGRRDDLFLSHKIANKEQSTDASTVRRAVKAAIGELGCSYLDLVSLHSPLTDKRLTSYEALLDLRESGFVQAVGVCNFGVAALEEILNADLDLPAVNQLEVTPFNQHKEVVEWCDKYGIHVTCSAVNDPLLSQQATEWDGVVQLAQKKQMTPNQVLSRWSLQKGLGNLSASETAVECSYGGLNTSPSTILTPEEMQTLDRLDCALSAGKLGRRDGWEAADVTGEDWDPTQFI